MTDERLAELRAMFDDITERSARRHDDPTRRYQAHDKVSVDFALMALATVCSAMVEVLDALSDVRNKVELLEAHSENLIERVYLLEGGDPMADRQSHHHQPPGHL